MDVAITLYTFGGITCGLGRILVHPFLFKVGLAIASRREAARKMTSQSARLVPVGRSAGGALAGRGRAPLRAALIGCGKWGLTLARAAMATGLFDLLAAADLRRFHAEAARDALSMRRATDKLTDLWADDEVEAVLVATNAASHFAVASEALVAGKHALVEKPLALNSAQCAELGAAAARAGRTLMAGHTFMYSPYVAAVRDVILSGEIGRIRYMHLQRLAFGQFRSDVNVTWNLGPHDVSILNFWSGTLPEKVRCVEHYCSRRDLADVALLTLDYGGFFGYAHLSCVDPARVRMGTVAGSAGGVVYDDTGGRVRLIMRAAAGVGETELAVEQADSLQTECRHFALSVAESTRPQTDVLHAMSVVAALEAATVSATSGGLWVPVRYTATEAS
jgi:predicted dehydrogenase